MWECVCVALHTWHAYKIVLRLVENNKIEELSNNDIM